MVVTLVGSAVGLRDGLAVVGVRVGGLVSPSKVGAGVGSTVGDGVGAGVVGVGVCTKVGSEVGLGVCTAVGFLVDTLVGSAVGLLVGLAVVGERVGLLESPSFDGAVVLGTGVGDGVGAVGDGVGAVGF